MELARRDASVLAISVDTPEESRGLARQLGGVSFPLLSDPDLQVAMQWGVAMEGRDIAVPATFIVAPGGRIMWREVGENMVDRPTARRLLWQLDEAKRRLHSR